MKKSIIALILAFSSAFAAEIVIKPGESQWETAKSHSTTPLYPRQVAVVAENNTYRVEHGDTMSKIARKLGISLQALVEANPNVNPNRIMVGQILRLPVANVIRVSNFVVEVAKIVNQERTKRGLPSLKLEGNLTRVAQAKAQDMLKHKYFSHTSPSYGSPFEMIKKFGISYSYAGENIAKGQVTPHEVMGDWMESPGHRRNILNPNFDTIGVGHSQGIWVQLFIKER